MKKIMRVVIFFILLVGIPGNIANAFVPSSIKADAEYKTIVYFTKATSKNPLSVHFEIKNSGKSPVELANFVFTFENLTDKTHFWGVTPIFRYTNRSLQIDKNKKISITIPLSEFKFVNTDGSSIALEQVEEMIKK